RPSRVRTVNKYGAPVTNPDPSRSKACSEVYNVAAETDQALPVQYSAPSSDSRRTCTRSWNPPWIDGRCCHESSTVPALEISPEVGFVITGWPGPCGGNNSTTTDG